MIRLQIPATSANLGAGFDALGLALSYYNYVNMEEAEGCHITSIDGTEIPTDENNLIYHTAKTVYSICGRDFKGLKI
ncbi:MAG: homoserine kinase, partial [Oscillospiraceae bacterium]|nr:homoserine kinase [Oscillospiraceae bacterium]